jgi:hypothetical protein
MNISAELIAIGILGVRFGQPWRGFGQPWMEGLIRYPT